jgi:hypothetical protein
MAQLLQLVLEDRQAAQEERQAAQEEHQANLAALQQIAQLAANNNGNGGREPRSRLRDFQNTKPPVFSRSV